MNRSERIAAQLTWLWRLHGALAWSRLLSGLVYARILTVRPRLERAQEREHNWLMRLASRRDDALADVSDHTYEEQEH